MCFALGLYGSARAANVLPVAWAILPPRVVGVAFVAIPLLALRRFRISRAALPFVVTTGVVEVLGYWFFALAARESIALASVLSSMFAPIAAVAAYVVFRERLSRARSSGSPWSWAGSRHWGSSRPDRTRRPAAWSAARLRPVIPQDRLRNFSIIAHIDHGKSTLADRLLEATHTIDARQMTSQVLDSMDLEREKGITIKARAVRLDYQAKDGRTYGLNLIDTPGHVDFAYEVSRSLQACEGAILVVDAAQGIEAQTLANVHLALRENLTIVPVVNKIDLPSAEPDLVIEELESVLAIPREEVILASAKEGIGIEEILEAIVERIPPPKGDPGAPLQGLIFDSHYDAYKGVVVYVRLAAGTLHAHDTIRLMASGVESELLELGVFRPQLVPVRELRAGEVGYVATGLKSVRDAQVGDTVTNARNPAAEPLPGYQEAKSLVFAGIYPISGEDYPLLRDALEKLHLNDASFTYTPESSIALGFGFRCGFLGLLHMEIVQERLEREFDLDLIASAPSVEYRVVLTNGRGVVAVDNPALMPSAGEIEVIEEPWVTVKVVTPSQLHRGADGPVDDPPRDVPRPRVPRSAAGPDVVRDAAGRAHRRLLRPAQEPQPGLCLDGLRGGRLPPGQPGQARRPRRRRAGRRAQPDRPPRQRPVASAGASSRRSRS